jgi:protein-glutamine gamma-glutamyltransferase
MLQTIPTRVDRSIGTAIGRYFEVSLYLLVLTGFATLASTGGLDFPTVVLVGLALFVRGYFLAPGRRVVIPERWTTYLTLAYVVFYLVDYLWLSGSFLTSTVHLVLFGMAVRLFSSQRERDHYMLAVLAFLMVLAAAVLTVDSIFMFAFAAFMLMAVVTFVLMEMRHSSEAATIQSREPEGRQTQRAIALSLATVAPVLMLLILVGAGGIFFLLPRVSSRYLTAYAPSNDLSTGFSDRVQLGLIGQIQQSSALVMHVQIDGDTSGLYDLKWRGVALSLFDGRTWTNPLEHAVAPRLQDGSFYLVPARSQMNSVDEEPAPRSIHTIHYRVMMEPVGSNVFFLAAKPAMLQGDYRMLTVDRAGAVYNVDGEHPISRYEATSNIAGAAREDLRSPIGPFPPGVLLTYLQLPPKLDSRIPRLAQEVTASSGSAYDKAVALEHYLATSFGYTLQLPLTSPVDPVANFLFERKRGHCEYFASSMALMLRTLQIPSRVVNGFRTGEFNDLTSKYVVHASDAHSWVEAYFPGQGWITFDPTPAAPPLAHNRWDRAMLYLDAAASFWREWVVNYDATHQKSLGQDAARNTRSLLDSGRWWVRRHYLVLLNSAQRVHDRIWQSPGRWGMAGVFFAVCLLLLSNTRTIWMSARNRRLRAHPERAPRFAATIWYEQMTRSLARRGWSKSPVQTPQEFTAAIEDERLRERVEKFTRHYESARFGNSAEDAQRLPQLYEEIKIANRK